MRRILAVTTLSTLLACGGSSPPPPPLPFTITCGTYNAGEAVGTVLAAVFDPVRATATVLAVETAAGPRSVTCPAGQRLCLTAMPEVVARTAGEFDWLAVQVTADVGAGPQRLNCTGFSLLGQPTGTAVVSGGQVTATWAAVPGAVKYRATLRDLGPPGVAPATVLERLTTTGTQATFALPGPVPALAVVEVEAWATDPDVPLLGALPPTGANRSMRALPFGSAPWSLRLPSEFTGSTLTIPIPAGQRLAVTLLNIGGQERAAATIEVAGTAAQAPAVTAARRLGPGADDPAGFLGWLRDHLDISAWREPLDAAARSSRLAAAAPPPTTRTFCTKAWSASETFLGFRRRPATLVRTTATALFYLDDGYAADLTPADWDALTATWESGQAVLAGLTGPAPDVDGNGKEIFFFTGVMGPAGYVGGWVGDDASAPLDTTPNCTGTGSNQADMMHINTAMPIPDETGALLSHADSLALIGYILIHEFQHLVDLRRFCLDRSLCFFGEGLLVEGRAELGATQGGEGYHLPTHLRIRSEFFGRGVPGKSYPSLRLYPWEFTNAGYGSAGLFLQYLADRLGPGYVAAFFREGNSLAALEAVSGLPFPVAYGLWTSALLFSNEPANPWPVLDYTGADWTPLHQKGRRFEYGPLSPGPALPVVLRQNGFDVYVTGVADTGGGTLTITSSTAVKPHVVVVPFSGALP